MAVFSRCKRQQKEVVFLTILILRNRVSLFLLLRDLAEEEICVGAEKNIS
jgi:hypothetical protein